MDNLKDRKVLPMHRPGRDVRHSADGSPQEGEIGWEEEYFSRLSESAKSKSEMRAAQPWGNRVLTSLALSDIRVSPFQTREIAGDAELEDLKNSIISRGVIQPVLVRRLPDETGYELIAGERRYRASILAGAQAIPAIIEDFTDQESLELSIIENAQRENLNAIEEAKAYALLADRFKLPQAEIAKIVGKNRATISNSLRLLHLEPEVIELLRSEELTAGHGRALLMVEDPEVQLKLARLAVRKALSVRTLENIVSRLDETDYESDQEQPDPKAVQSRIRMEEKIGGYLGIEKVKLASQQDGSRRLTLNFDTEAAWKRFMSKIRE